MEFIFDKYHGTGNDFILMDNRNGMYDVLSVELIALLCHRRFGIGADGLMLLGEEEGLDFKMKYFNADGRPGSMCGNGARCIIDFAYQQGIKKKQFIFNAPDGLHEGFIEDENIRVTMRDAVLQEQMENVYIINTGSPHYVIYTSGVKDLNVFEEGKKIRNSDRFRKDGINVNFVEQTSDHSIYVRTFERGVEDETLSCGTGVTAAALVMPELSNGKHLVTVETPGGKLGVEFFKEDQQYSSIILSGPAIKVFSGSIQL